MLGIHVLEGTAEGWFGPGKKSAIISIVVLATLVLGVSVGIFAALNGRGGTQGGLRGEEGNVSGLFPGSQSAGSVPEIKYIPVAEAKGLEVGLNVVAGDWKQGVLSAIVKVKNTRSEMLITAKLTTATFSQSGVQGTSGFSVNRLKPGDTATLDLKMLEVMNVSSIKRVEVSFDTKNLIWETAPNSSPTPTLTRTPEPTPKLTSSSKELGTPEEVVKAYLDSLIKMDYKKFVTFLSSRQSRTIPTEEKFIKEFTSQDGSWFIKNFVRMEVTKVEINGEKATVEGIFYFKEKSSSYPRGIDPSVSYRLVKEDGKWKITN